MSRCFPQLHTWREAAQVVQPNTLHLPTEAALTAAKRDGRAILVLPDGKTERVTFPCADCGAPLAEHTHGPLVDGGCKRTGCKEYAP